MLFYAVEGIIENKKIADDASRRETMAYRAELRDLTEDYNQSNEKKAHVYITGVDKETLKLVCAVPTGVVIEQILDDYIDHMDMEISNGAFKEVTFSSFCNGLMRSDRESFIDDDDETLDSLGLVNYDMKNIHFQYDDTLIAEHNQKSLLQEAKEILCEETLLPELMRIYQGTKCPMEGYPVHYLLECDNVYIRKKIYKNLLSALYGAGRIHSKRYVYMDIYPDSRVEKRALHDIYEAATDSTIVIRYLAGADKESNAASSQRANIDIICSVILEYRNKVQTLLCMPRGCTSAKEMFYENMEDMMFIELKEDLAGKEKAKKYLRAMAKEKGMKCSNSLFKKLEDGKEYFATDLTRIFNEWYNEELLNTYYPQYRTAVSARKKIAKAEVHGSAYKELQNMIGLSEAKKVIEDALNYAKAQKVLGDKGMMQDMLSMHMIFTGNPGTAKTTVARLFAEIMKDNHVLSRGHMVEVGRGDLVGKYVGWTADIVKKKFKEASGGVLFIDEAYSLVDDRNGSFGDEAINTIVQEMENHRKDVVVIFAGYPDKMELFLEKNPGLRSRIAYHVPFEDYSTEELMEIADLMAGKLRLKFDADAKEKLQDILGYARKDSEFGNGRYVRNILERARMTQATRLMQKDLDDITEDDVATICSMDIVEQKTERKTLTIGFSA